MPMCVCVCGCVGGASQIYDKSDALKCQGIVNDTSFTLYILCVREREREKWSRGEKFDSKETKD